VAKHLYLNEKGLIEEVDTETGESRPLQLSPEDLLKYEPCKGKDGRTTWVPRAISHYTPALGELFAFHILDGKGVRSACQEIGITYLTYSRWKRDFEHFANVVEDARRDRAEKYFDYLQEIADNTEADEDEVALGRLKTDIYKHLAQVSDPRRFSPTTKIDAKIGFSKVVVDTGIRRVGDEGHRSEDLLDITAAQEQLAATEVLPASTVQVVPVAAQGRDDE
jgi:hypothetical protein